MLEGNNVEREQKGAIENIKVDKTLNNLNPVFMEDLILYLKQQVTTFDSKTLLTIQKSELPNGIRSLSF